MNLYLIVFSSEINKKEQVYENHKELFVELEKYFTLYLVNYQDADSIPSHEYKMAFISSGGVEAKVVSNFSIFPYPITLLADGLNNSLAAALEIAAWVQSKDMKVRIIHGPVPEMVKQVLLHHQAFAARRSLKGKRIGVIGTPSSWLVSSHVNYLLASKRWGVTYLDIPLDNVYNHYQHITDDEVGVEASVFANRAKACQDATPEDLLKAMRLYKAVKKVCEEEHLDAITLACFAILQDLGITGCLTLSLLNDEGIPAGCEGDLQSIMSLLMIRELIGQPGFMANPTFVNSRQNEILLSHCCIPTKMIDDFIIRNHFESNSGIAIQGLLHEGDITLFKCGGECLDEYFVSSGYLKENTNLMAACRTQVKIKLQKDVNYFLQSPLGNHHILIKGDYTEVIQEFMQQNRCKVRE